MTESSGASPTQQGYINPVMPGCHLKTTNKIAKFEILEPFCLLFRKAGESVFIKTRSIGISCYRTGKNTVGRRVRASFSAGIFKAGAVTGLRAIEIRHKTQQQKPEWPTVTLTWHASKYKVHILHQRYILCLLACQVRVTVGHSGLSCVCVTSFER